MNALSCEPTLTTTLDLHSFDTCMYMHLKASFQNKNYLHIVKNTYLCLVVVLDDILLGEVFMLFDLERNG